jgi:hypothetical protein
MYIRYEHINARCTVSNSPEIPSSLDIMASRQVDGLTVDRLVTYTHCYFCCMINSTFQFGTKSMTLAKSRSFAFTWLA